MSSGRVVIVGAGGHAREVAEILSQRERERAGPRLLGFVADDPENYPAEIGGVPFLGDWAWFDGADPEGLAVVCAVGLPQLRKYLVGRAAARGFRFASAVSPLAYVSPEAHLGEGVMVFPQAFVSAGSHLGDHAVVNVGASVSHDTGVGRYATLGPGVRVAGRVSVGEGSYLGIGASVIDRVSIGAWATVGGGACVTRDLPDNVTAVGVPARVIKTRGNGWHEETTGFGGR
ncbi:MAG TPA: acetyltransferase [Pyrinomonadaceae bacterium]|jgi:sugar O-acyltransferase (sialic acid O-acetyltransferase NeuD family)|nr:acetyltransferase [Pyrinomonadaceae bacterium]